jgi:hypothetical protein
MTFRKESVMPGLVDIAQSVKTVPVAGIAVTVPGVSVKGIAVLLAKHTVLRELFSGKAADITPETFMALAPEVLAGIIAAGTGAPGDEDAERIAANLSLDDQLVLVEAIIEATMPRGVAPFVEGLTALMARADGVKSMPIPAMNSPKPSSP